MPFSVNKWPSIKDSNRWLKDNNCNDEDGNPKYLNCNSCNYIIDCENEHIFCLNYRKYIDIILCQDCYPDEDIEQFKHDGWECDDWEAEDSEDDEDEDEDLTKID